MTKIRTKTVRYHMSTLEFVEAVRHSMRHDETFLNRHSASMCDLRNAIASSGPHIAVVITPADERRWMRLAEAIGYDGTVLGPQLVAEVDI